jgi:7,8-dihydropterin-6-yl-methyl-4-(beta-D-ribofuranosyl)aminobenzene 5'-phosphate synthase
MITFICVSHQIDNRWKRGGIMKITIIYDNEVWEKGLTSDWGFSALVEVNDKKILFDTGASGAILLSNMEKLGIDPTSFSEVFISHYHWDHTGGLPELLTRNRNIKVYSPPSFHPSGAKEIVAIEKPSKIYEGIYSTGELARIEQSMAVRTEKGLVVIAGCSHPGVPLILKTASLFGSPYALIGGLHGFKEFKILENLEIVCPTHCTQYKREIKRLYPQKYIEGGVGRIISFPFHHPE